MNLSEIAKKLVKEKKTALFCHVRPDGDSLGSALALKCALDGLGVQTDVVCADPVPSRFFFLKETLLVKNSLDGEYSALIELTVPTLQGLATLLKRLTSTKTLIRLTTTFQTEGLRK